MQTRTLSVTKVKEHAFLERDDDIVIEEPLEIFVNGRGRFFCMRTPGSDIELAVGLCFSDGLIQSYGDIKTSSAEKTNPNRVDVTLAGAGELLSHEQKIIRSSTGFIKADDMAGYFGSTMGTIPETAAVSIPNIFSLQKELISRQKIFKRTGGTHAAALFDRNGALLSFAEDVGRHNCLDKCIGRVVIDNRMKDAAVAMLSSRLSYEMVTKACRLGIEIVAGASAPTSLAVTIAGICNQTLIGFVREATFTVYSCPQRVTQ